jgi:SpoVK/Ycf46/Vps4 family AAA+-type ATPase
LGKIMATADQIKSLIRSYSSDDKEKFYSVALQVAAHEAKRGHTSLAHEIRGMLDTKRKSEKHTLKIVSFPNELKGLILPQKSIIPKSSLVIEKAIAGRIEKVIHEYYQREKLKAHGLSNRRKLLLVGPPGTGKTMTAQVLSNELHLPLNIIQVDRLVTKFMGETSAKLRLIFEHMKQNVGIYFFDEFDAIGGDRNLDNDVGEMRRVLNAFLQFLEQDDSDSLILGATNNPNLLDAALFRRFDDVISYKLPENEQRKDIISNVLGTFKSGKFSWSKVLEISNGFNCSEITSATKDAIKDVVLSDKNKVSSSILIEAFQHRKNIY